MSQSGGFSFRGPKQMARRHPGILVNGRPKQMARRGPFPLDIVPPCLTTNAKITPPPPPHQTKRRKLNVLESWALKLIKTDAAGFIKTPEFLEMELPQLRELLKSDELNCSEVELFQAVVKWGKRRMTTKVIKLEFPDSESDAESDSDSDDDPDVKSLSEELWDVIGLIRFPLMSMDVIERVVIPEDVLTGEEAWELCKYLHSTPANRAKMNYKTFRTRPRAAAAIIERSNPGSSQSSLNKLNAYEHMQ